MFQCHQTDRDSDAGLVCAGWAGCHDGEHLLALRLALFFGTIDAATYEAVVGYESPVKLFASGSEAAAHGLMDIDQPSAEAERLMSKIYRRRSDHQTP